VQERIVRATAAHYVISPNTLGSLGRAEGQSTDRFSATFQVAVAARTIREVAELSERARHAGKRLTTLTLDTSVRFATPASREAFANDLVHAISGLVAKYHDGLSPDGRSYRLCRRPSGFRKEGRMTRFTMLAIWCALGGVLVAQQAPPTSAERPSVVDLARPGPEHAALKALEGQWTRDITFTMGGGRQMKARGTASNRMIRPAGFSSPITRPPSPLAPSSPDWLPASSSLPALRP